MPKGDHLIVSRGTYFHHGLDLGDGRVMQYGGGVSEANARVEIVDRETFSRDKPVRVMERPAAYSPDEIIARAYRRLGEQDYSLVWDNCEHFVNWCRTGESRSQQVDSISEWVVSSAAKLATSYALGTILKSTTKASAKTMTRGVTPWLLVADGAQLATEFVTAQMGAGEKDAETAGQVVGIGSSAAVGAMVGGPAGAVVSTGLWAMGEVVGKRVSTGLLQRFGGNRRTPPDRLDKSL
uniref:Lecithin retinol acyltransferase n=1 Tax=Candidatus Kentrum sp. FW TaxID=2126338 RepID=A0A450U335_9GAMM|nr:MAG: Lecithin retinol acyltransferase [Candidatus Kentron sp. FW]